MQEWLKKICEYIMLYIAGPAAATIVAYFFERRKEKRDMAPLLQMIIFDSKEKLRLNQEEVKKNKRIIQRTEIEVSKITAFYVIEVKGEMCVYSLKNR